MCLSTAIALPFHISSATEKEASKQNMNTWDLLYWHYQCKLLNKARSSILTCRKTTRNICIQNLFILLWGRVQVVIKHSTILRSSAPDIRFVPHWILYYKIRDFIWITVKYFLCIPVVELQHSKYHSNVWHFKKMFES